MDRVSTGLEVTRRHLLRLVGGVAVLVQPAFAQQPMQQSTERRTAMEIERNGSRPSTKGRKIISAARSASNRFFKSAIPCG